MIISKTRQELKEVLMDPQEDGVKEPYFIIQGESGQNITVVTPGKNGEEFNKTYGHFSDVLEAETYHVLYGQGVMVQQRNDEEGEAKEFRVISLRPGVTVEVPSGSGYSLINVGKNYLVVVDNSAQKKQEGESGLRERKGFVYYIVDKKGDVGFQPNPNYRIHPQITVG